MMALSLLFSLTAFAETVKPNIVFIFIDEHFVCFEAMRPKIDRKKTPIYEWTKTYMDKSIDFIRRN